MGLSNPSRVLSNATKSVGRKKFIVYGALHSYVSLDETGYSSSYMTKDESGTTVVTTMKYERHDHISI